MLGRTMATLGVAGATCLAYGIAIEAVDFRVRRVDVPILPPGADEIRVLHVSDIHLLPRQRRKLDFLRGLAGLEPDLVINTGDNLAAADAVVPLADAFARLSGVPGAFVFGSNDFHGPRVKNPLAYTWRTSASDRRSRTNLPTDDLRRALEGLGWHDVNEGTAEVEVRGLRLALRGTSDYHEHRADYSQVAGPVPAGAIGLGVTHAPYQALLDAMVSDGVRLVLAGHTHGGQVCVPGYGALTTNCDLPHEHASGLFTREVNGRRGYVHVSAGIGMSPFTPFRFACPPEATLLRLVPGPGM